MKSDQSDQKLVAVVGMHRSGTSAITRGLRVLDIALGDRLEPAAEGINDKGYWEDIDIVALNVEMMKAIGTEWHCLAPLRSVDTERLRSEGYLLRAVELLRQKLSNAPYFGFKDPRTAKMLPFWMEVFQSGGFDVSFVVVVRNPLSVVKSLHNRDGFAAEKSYLLWVGHVISSLQLLRRKPLVLVDYDRLMQSPETEVHRLARTLRASVQRDQLELYKSEFLDHELRHTVYQPPDLFLDDAAPPLAREMYSAVLDIASDVIAIDDPSIDARVAQWSDEFERIRSALKLADKYELEAARTAGTMAERDRRIGELGKLVADRNSRIADLSQLIGDRDGLIRDLDEAIAGRDEAITGRDKRIAELARTAEDRQSQISRLSGTIDEIRASTSWRITAPMRSVSSIARRAFTALRPVRQSVAEAPADLPRPKPDWRQAAEGTGGAAHPPPAVPVAPDAPSLSIVPYYVDPKIDEAGPTIQQDISIAIHIHLFYREMLGEFSARLESLTLPFDLYVSIAQSSNPASVYAELRAALPHARNVFVEPVPNRGRDLAPLIVQFGERLTQYDVVGHFHTKRSPHNRELGEWCSSILDALLGAPGNPGGRISHLLELLQADGKVVYPEGNLRILKDPTGWADNGDLASELLASHSTIFIGDFPVIDFPEGSMFWARAHCLRGFLTLPLSYDDFPVEPIAADGTLAHALERLVLVFASQHEGKCYRLHKGDSIPDYRHYEEQRDYSCSIAHRDVRVLAYYLPQFHPIPENDLWHGEGFTEWSKVRSATPLFDGHYQQHIPHPDIGYYLLDSPDVLRHQAELMRQAGVHGMVFYHYSFGAKLILEEPAQLLRDHPDIEIPFCFCWANENWTRRWDGNEQEVLLGQEYSADNALGFIRYLIPFFRDRRYITVEKRPVLFVYRPSSIPDVREYLSIWENECLSNGIARPYVVAVLTRGATDPRHFGMDAGVERVLHDWTAGSVPEIKKSLRLYRPVNGSVLSYDDVVAFYTKQAAPRDFAYFPSLVPIWDNTARYGSEAYLVHGSTPRRFQEWLQSCIVRAQSTLPEDRRFVLVNAWNEWAEGAHLEPDSRFGYGYLNAVGRALSAVAYVDELRPGFPVPAGLKVHLTLPELIREQLRADPDLKKRFVECLMRSSVFGACSCTIGAAAIDLFDALPCPFQDQPDGADYVLEFHRVSLFDATAIERMIQTACQCPGSVVVPNGYGRGIAPVEVTGNSSVRCHAAHEAPMALLPAKVSAQGYRNCRMRSDAHCFVTFPSTQPPEKRPQVTTIIRVHRSANAALLKDALYCLAAMQDCVVVPMIAAQDFSEQQAEELQAVLRSVPLAGGVQALVHHYRSADGNGDLRSKMLNESLLRVGTRYAAFLDYDDLLMSDAYAWLIGRLRRTGKAVALGCVYVTAYDGASGLWLERKRVYEGRHTYDEFKEMNNSPVHSFMLDLERLDLSRVVYHEDQRYMEDYFLTLQLFTRDNVDWASLAETRYIGDYIHSVDRAHTLALTDDEERQALVRSPEYKVCLSRINQLQRSLH